MIYENEFKFKRRYIWSNLCLNSITFGKRGREVSTLGRKLANRFRFEHASVFLRKSGLEKVVNNLLIDETAQRLTLISALNPPSRQPKLDEPAEKLATLLPKDFLIEWKAWRHTYGNSTDDNLARTFILDEFRKSFLEWHRFLGLFWKYWSSQRRS